MSKMYEKISRIEKCYLSLQNPYSFDLEKM